MTKGTRYAIALTAANNDVFIILAVASVLLLLVALALPGRRKTLEIIANEQREPGEAVLPVG